MAVALLLMLSAGHSSLLASIDLCVTANQLQYNILCAIYALDVKAGHQRASCASAVLGRGAVVCAWGYPPVHICCNE